MAEEEFFVYFAGIKVAVTERLPISCSMEPCIFFHWKNYTGDNTNSRQKVFEIAGITYTQNLKESKGMQISVRVHKFLEMPGLRENENLLRKITDEAKLI